MKSEKHAETKIVLGRIQTLPATLQMSRRWKPPARGRRFSRPRPDVWEAASDPRADTVPMVWGMCFQSGVKNAGRAARQESSKRGPPARRQRRAPIRPVSRCVSPPRRPGPVQRSQSSVTSCTHSALPGRLTRGRSVGCVSARSGGCPDACAPTARSGRDALPRARPSGQQPSGPCVQHSAAAALRAGPLSWPGLPRGRASGRNPFGPQQPLPCTGCPEGDCVPVLRAREHRLCCPD